MSDAHTEQDRLIRQGELADILGLEMLGKIVTALSASRKKYPEFAVDSTDAFDVVKSEMLEWESQAMRIVMLGDAKQARADEEALHVICVLIRWLNREYRA